MPRGVPKNGVRMTKNRLEKASATRTPAPVSTETDEQIDAKLNERFEILEEMVDGALASDVRALIVSGPAGLGKSFTVEEKLAEFGQEDIDYTIVKGYVRATGLYKLLFQNQAKGQVIVFDDADSIFFDDVSLNMLKAVCDTTEVRRVSYLSEAVLVDEDSATRLPRSFTFNGTIIFITNYDFDEMIDRGHKLAPHLQALVSRSHYVDLAMKTRRDYIIRIRQVLAKGMLAKNGLTKEQEQDVVNFIDKHQDTLRELSLRMALKLGTIRKSSAKDWEKIARITCCRNA